ncbi:MFS transporter [Streptomyces avermitilis]|uniref:MFS transporter n=1 Tax=Streptomyces avermitilis TaxID=33903 RepID=UPI0033BB0DFA
MRGPTTAWFGTVSLLADFVYEGARSITGPLLASLGASALVVGVVTGAGEAAALGLRLVSGPLADRTRRFWGLAIAGYALTVVAVPLLGVAGVLWAACVLVVAERVGKAVCSPAKDTLLSHATAATGRGRGFAVHEAMDQIGALLGPLLVAGVLALTGNDYGPALGVLAVPGIAVLLLLFRLRARVPDPEAYEREVQAASTRSEPQAGDERLTSWWGSPTSWGLQAFGDGASATPSVMPSRGRWQSRSISNSAKVARTLKSIVGARVLCPPWQLPASCGGAQ